MDWGERNSSKDFGYCRGSLQVALPSKGISVSSSQSLVEARREQVFGKMFEIANNNNSPESVSESSEAAKLVELAEEYSRVLAESFYLQNVRGNVFNFDSYVNKAHSGLLGFLKSKSFIRDDENVLLRGLYNGQVPNNAPFKPSPVKDKVDIKVKSSSTTTTHSRLSESASIPPIISTSIITTNSATTHPQIHKYSEKLKAEASVVQRISELQKEGMWYDKRLPRIHEAARNKTHWDYLLEEMVWLAADFASERKWKRAASRRCAKMVDKYFSDRKAEQKRAEKEEEIKLRRIASRMAKEINNFWSNVQKLVEYKEQSRIEELRKKALDQQLSYIVDQTEKYSSMLAESFITDNNNSSVLDSTVDGADDSSTLDPNLTCTATSLNLSDDEFEPDFESGEDDEETIAKAEEDAKDVNTEIEALHRESLLPLDDFLDELPAGYIEECKARYKVTEESEGTSTSKEEDEHTVTVEQSDIPEKKEEQDAEKIVTADSSTEDDSGPIDSSITQTESEDITEQDPPISISTKESQDEEPVRRKSISNEEAMDTGTTTSDFESGTEETEDEEEEDDDDDDDEGSDSNEGSDRDSDFDMTEDELEPEDEEQTVGLASLLQTFAPERAGEDHDDDDALNSVAAMAESFQPKGYTLSSTTVVTKVPFLLKHELREYQHIGLDWLVTMHEKKLNGILADEMGLGKTIQTIALLAHLACEKGNWGPHLIVVPTSVMLNWEMEFKKWCPGFKILTYYGSIKERRLKRTGWTKPNAFHVCITSYKLVIQDHASFRRKRWKYLILDEAQNIKNFKSQRWQLLLNFATHRRLLLTGTPLQNNLMELWSLMHFLMPNVFQSHREFREWFSNPMSGMVEGNSEYNENIIRRLHKVLRPFILRRLKLDVEKQLPQKYEHVVMCRLSKRQRYLYEEFMSRTKTKETLATGNLLSVINVLMQLRKVCNHPNLFESRPVISPFQSGGLSFQIPSIVWNMFALYELERLNRAVSSMSHSDLYFSKFEAQRIWNLRPLGVEQLNDDASSSSPSRLKRKRDSSETAEVEEVDADITEYDYVLQTTVCGALSDGSIRCAPKKKRFLKWCADDLAVSVPRTSTPIPFFLMNVDPMPYLEDNNFVEVLGAGAPKPTCPVNNERNPNGRVEMVTKISTTYDLAGSRSVETPSSIQKSGGRITKRNSEASQQSSTNSVVLKSSKKENVHEESEGDDEEDEEESFEEEDLDISVEYEDTPTSGRKRKKKTSLSISRESKRLKMEQVKQEDGSADENSIGEAMSRDEYESSCSDDDTLVKRNKIRFTPAQSIKGLQWARSVGLNPIEFQEADVQLRSIQNRRALIERLQFVNDRRCEILPMMGADTVDKCKVIGQLPRMRYYGTRVRHLGIHYKGHSIRRNYKDCAYFNRGYEEVCSVSTIKNSQSCSRLRNHPLVIWRHTKALINMITTLEEVLEEYSPILKRFMLYVPAVSAPVLSPRVFRPNPSLYLKQMTMEQELKEMLRKPIEIFHPIISSMTTQFPDPRLIQYDCGKLQVLDGLLRRLKAGSHRILIFTQMARMLDVLEVFLNYHGYIYLRLDGATKIDQRQLLMEKFNTDKRIFCFILSTRSGGIGVNLTGADTVIFYDSDWNPTMDAQAQDRCHRIGQTRDVHIYRLVSEKTVEENILKKSNQKRLLGELAINDGNFTTASFAKQSIKDLFEVRNDKPDMAKRLEAIAGVVDVEAVSEKIVETSVSPPPSPPPSSIIEPELVEENLVDDTSKQPEIDKSQIQLFETALAAAEDEMDVQATRTVKAEAAAELAEFDESIPLEELGDGQEMVESSMVDIEMQSVMAELNAVERYALRFMENTINDWSTETLAQAQKEMEQQKRDWELEQMRKLELQMKASPELSDEEDHLLTYYSSDAQNQVWISQGGEEVMPLWAPPTPPQDEDDVYFDPCHGFLYDFTIIPESSLPPVYSPPKKEKKSMNTISIPLKTSPTTITSLSLLPQEEESGSSVSSIEKKPKIPRRDEPIFAPRSLFDRPSPQMAKLRRDYRLQKYNCRPVVATTLPKQTLGPGAITFPIVHPSTKAPSPPPQHESVEWMIAEDYALLQTVQTTLELPLSLLVVNLAQTPNWDLAAEMVNLNSRTYRTPKQCKLRYETIVGPREEGKLLYEQPTAVKPKKKVKGTFIKLSPPSPSKTGRIMKMSQLMSSDNNAQLMSTFMGKFDASKHIANKRPAISKPMTLNPHMKSNKQSTIFTEHSITFDNPLPATAIAVARLERIQLERKKLYAAQQSAQGGAAASHPVTTAALAAAIASNSPATSPQPVTVGSSSNSLLAQAVAQQPQQQVVTVSAVMANQSTSTSATASEAVQKAKIAAAQHSIIGSTSNSAAITELIARQRVPATPQQKRQYALTQQHTQLQQQLQLLQQHQQKQPQIQIQLGQAGQQQGTTTAQQIPTSSTAQVIISQSSVVSKPQLTSATAQQQKQQLQLLQQHQIQQKQPQIQIQLGQQQGTSTAQQIPTSSTAQVIISQSSVVSKPQLTSATAQQQKQQLQLLQQHQIQQKQPQIQIQLGQAGQQHGTASATAQQIPTSSTAQVIISQSSVVSKPQLTSSTAQQKQQQTQVHVHFHNPQGGQVHQAQTMVLPQGFALGVAGSQNIASNQLTGLMTTTTPVASVTSSGTTPLTATSFPRTQQTISQPGQPQGRTVTMQLVKQHTVGGKTVTRTVSDAEVAAFLKQHGLTSSARVAIAGQPGTQAQIGQLTAKGQLTQVQVPTAQILTSVGLQKLGYQIAQSNSGAVLKTPASQGSQTSSGGQGLAFPVSFSQVKNVGQKPGGQAVAKQGGQASNIQQQFLAQRQRSQQQQHQGQQTASKLAHITGSQQLIVQGSPKQIQNVSVQHIQHVLKPGQVIGQGGQVIQAQLLTGKPITRVATSSPATPTVVSVANSAGGIPITIPTSLVAGSQPGIIRISQPNQQQLLKPGSIQVQNVISQTAFLLSQQQPLARPSYLSSGQTINVTPMSGGQPVSIRLQGSTGLTASSLAGYSTTNSSADNQPTNVVTLENAPAITITEESDDASSDVNNLPTS